jgi:hypothetical protein
LVNKLDLLEMDAADMLDVLHYFLDEDMRYATAESAQMHTNVRETLYGVLYGAPYKYGVKGSSNRTSSAYDEGATKPYVAPTDFDGSSPLPFGDALEAPIG